MLIIDSAEAMARALALPLDPHLTSLLRQRRDDLEDPDWEFEDVARIVVVGANDTLAGVEEALGIPIATDLVDGHRFGDPDFIPSWEWAERHSGGWIEIAFILSDDGFGHVVLVPDRDDTDAELISLCREYAVPAVQQVGSIAE